MSDFICFPAKGNKKIMYPNPKIEASACNKNNTDCWSIVLIFGQKKFSALLRAFMIKIKHVVSLR